MWAAESGFSFRQIEVPDSVGQPLNCQIVVKRAVGGRDLSA